MHRRRAVLAGFKAKSPALVFYKKLQSAAEFIRRKGTPNEFGGTKTKSPLCNTQGAF